MVKGVDKKKCIMTLKISIEIIVFIQIQLKVESWEVIVVVFLKGCSMILKIENTKYYALKKITFRH